MSEHVEDKSEDNATSRWEDSSIVGHEPESEPTVAELVPTWREVLVAANEWFWIAWAAATALSVYQGWTLSAAISGLLTGFAFASFLRVRDRRAEERLLALFRSEPLRWFYGLEMADRAEVASGTLYPHLARLERLGIIESIWEDKPRGKRRRLYRLTNPEAVGWAVKGG